MHTSIAVVIGALTISVVAAPQVQWSAQNAAPRGKAHSSQIPHHGVSNGPSPGSRSSGGQNSGSQSSSGISYGQGQSDALPSGPFGGPRHGGPPHWGPSKKPDYMDFSPVTKTVTAYSSSFAPPVVTETVIIISTTGKPQTRVYSSTSTLSTITTTITKATYHGLTQHSKPTQAAGNGTQQAHGPPRGQSQQVGKTKARLPNPRTARRIGRSRAERVAKALLGTLDLIPVLQCRWLPSVVVNLRTGRKLEMGEDRELNL